MKIIAKERGMGKTEYLIKKSLETGYPIICMNDGNKRLIMQRNKNVPVFTLREIKSGKYIINFDTVLIDELDYILYEAIGLRVEEATFTGDISIEQVENVPVLIKQDISMKR